MNYFTHPYEKFLLPNKLSQFQIQPTNLDYNTPTATDHLDQDLHRRNE